MNRNGTNGALSKNIIDLYAIRKSRENWRNKNLCDDIIDTLSDLSLLQFVEKYIAGKDSTIVKKTKDTTKTISIFSPTFKTSKESNTYYKYCWVSLLKYKPWEFYSESTFGDINDKDSCIDIDNIITEIQIKIINAWEIFSINNGNNDFLLREIERMQDVNERIEDDDNNIVQSQDGLFDADVNQPDYASIFQRYSNEDEELGDLEWNKNVDFNITNNVYLNNENSVNYISEKWKLVKTEIHVQLRPSTLISDLQSQQQLCVKTFLHICGLMKNENGIFIEEKRDLESSVPNGMIIVGTAGTGKSYAINGMINEIINRKKEKNEEKTVLVMAPTGRAAMQANGYTLQCKDGLSIPLFTGN